MLKAATGETTAEMADMIFVTQWTLRCALKQKEQYEFAKEQEKK